MAGGCRGRDGHGGFQPLLECGLLGAVLVQFPWSFKRTPEEREWLARVLETFQEFPLALETSGMRRGTGRRSTTRWRERQVAFCNIDQPMFSKSLPRPTR